MSATCEMDKCDFCHEVKTVERTYLRPSEYVKPTEAEEYCKLYNEGNYFIIVKTCNDCGTPKWQQDQMYSEEDLKYAYEQGKLYSNICYSREFDNVIQIIKTNKI